MVRGIRKEEPRRFVGTDGFRFEFAIANEGLASHAQDVGLEALLACFGDLPFQDSRCCNYSAGEDIA